MKIYIKIAFILVKLKFLLQILQYIYLMYGLNFNAI
jgi:hypothetical protein